MKKTISTLLTCYILSLNVSANDIDSEYIAEQNKKITSCRIALLKANNKDLIFKQNLEFVGGGLTGVFMPLNWKLMIIFTNGHIGMYRKRCYNGASRIFDFTFTNQGTSAWMFYIYYNSWRVFVARLMCLITSPWFVVVSLIKDCFFIYHHFVHRFKPGWMAQALIRSGMRGSSWLMNVRSRLKVTQEGQPLLIMTNDAETDQFVKYCWEHTGYSKMDGEEYFT